MLDADRTRFFGTLNTSKHILDGTGTLHFKNDHLYKGDLKDNNLHGLGTLYLPDGAQTKGEFLNNQPHGLHIYTNAVGGVFERMFKEGVMVSEKRI